MVLGAANVLVVGAGPSGLAALKELREVGINAIAVDQRPEFGGVFSPSSNVTYEKLYLTTTNMFIAFSDFPPEDEKVKYWTKQEYYEYLESYVRHFELRGSIHLEMKVKQATLVNRANESNKKNWSVQFVSAKGEETTRTFDYMIVATGASHRPYLPHEAFKGFHGEILHSSEYHSPSQVKNKNVLVLGVGESAADVVSSAGTKAHSVTVFSRHMPNTAPRFISKYLADTKYDEVQYLPLQDEAGLRPCDFLEIVTTSRIVRNMPLAAWSTVLQKGLFADLKKAHGDKSPAGLSADWGLSAYKADFFSADHSSVPTKTIMMCTAAAEGKMDLIVAPRIRCEGSKVVFEEPTYHGIEETKTQEDIPVDIDVIAACTGFNIAFDWINAPGIDEEDFNPRYWFKHCFPTTGSLAANLAFLGYARPHQGGIPQCSEMLARYIAQLISNPEEVKLPSNYKELALAEGACEAQCFHLSKHVLPLVDYPAFMYSISRLVGCEPKVPRSLCNIVKYWTFPLWPCFFRTDGVGSKANVYNEVLNKFGTFDGLAPMPLLAFEIALTFTMPFVNFFSYLMSQVIGPPKKGLPTAYKFRMSKLNFMSGNSLRLQDFGLVSLAQLAAGVAIVFHGIVATLASLPARPKIEPINFGM